MAHKKLIRFRELETFTNVLQYPPNMSGNWEAFFKNNHRYGTSEQPLNSNSAASFEVLYLPPMAGLFY